MFSDYIREREKFDVLEKPNGFAVYKIIGEECYIKDIYVKPEFRKDKVASVMANEITEIARDHGCKWLTGSVSLETGNPTVSTKVLLGYGFDIFRFKDNLLWFVKSI